MKKRIILAAVAAALVVPSVYVLSASPAGGASGVVYGCVQAASPQSVYDVGTSAPTCSTGDSSISWDGSIVAPSPSTSPSSSPSSSPSPSASTSTSSSPPTTCPVATANVPDGSDPNGGCFPGPLTTGPNGTLTAYTSGTLPAGNSGWTVHDGEIYVQTPGAVIDSIQFTGSVEMLGSATLTIENSDIQDGTIQNDTSGSPQGKLVITSSTIFGGTADMPDVASNNATLTGDNISGGEHGVSAEGPDVTVNDSYIHDLAPENSAGWHQNPIFDDSGSNLSADHDSLFCNPGAGCTSDFSMIADSSFSKVTLNDSLLGANNSTNGFCIYPGPDETSKPGTITDVTITNNVMQAGANGKCGIYGPVYSWSASGNTWSGNTWDNGSVLNP